MEFDKKALTANKRLLPFLIAMPLREAQSRVLEAFRALQRREGRPPTVRELGARLGMRSTRTVHDHLKALEAAGLLARKPGARGLRLASGEEGIPVLGRVAAGAPLLAERNLDGALDLGSFFGPSEQLFLLKVQGESMTGAGILPGDYVVVQQQEGAENGEIAVVLVDGEVTVKRVARRGQVLWLHPANEAFRPLAVDLRVHQAGFLGKVVGVVRQVS